MDAGGLAQMSYNNFPSSNGLGMPGSGFASRRANGSNIKRLSFEPKKPSDPQDNGAPTPRTSRSHLLAGLRTAPKSATSSTFPSTAPPTQLQHSVGLAGSIYADNKENYGGPKTALYSNQQQMGYGQMHGNRQMYSVPEQVLAPPEILVDEHGQEQMDPNLYAQLVATNMYLAEQQQRLQQQLMNVQAAAQQFQGMNLGGNQMQQQFATPPITPQNMYQQQQVKSNMQPIITPVPGAQAGVYSCYNPMTGQQTYFMDQSAQQNQYMDQQVVHQQVNYSPPQQHGTPRFQVSPPPQSETAFTRSISPPKKAASPPQDHAPLPPPSAGAFRRGHRKANSMAIGTDVPLSIEGPKSALLPKSMGFPQTPTAFGPGQGRAGEHPVRQPRGPPPLDELKAKPTTKFEGSKNFATRTRRNAVHNLVRAGMERRRGPGSAGSGSMSPVSEAGEITFSVSSDNDSDSGRSGSGSLSGRPTLGSPRTSVHGAIGSNRPSSRQKERSLERKSVASMDSSFTTASVSSDEGSSVGGSFAAVFKNGGKKLETSEIERKAPMLVLSSAEKRKSFVN